MPAHGRLLPVVTIFPSMLNDGSLVDSCRLDANQSDTACMIEPEPTQLSYEQLSACPSLYSRYHG